MGNGPTHRSRPGRSGLKCLLEQVREERQLTPPTREEWIEMSSGINGTRSGLKLQRRRDRRHVREEWIEITNTQLTFGKCMTPPAQGRGLKLPK